MPKRPDCPYHHGTLDGTIYCKRGEIPGKIEGVSVTNHMEHYCSDKYTQCRCYKFLEKSWGGRRNVKTVSVRQAISQAHVSVST